MPNRRTRAPWYVAGLVGLVMHCTPFAASFAQRFAADERAALDAWYYRTAQRTPGGRWGIAVTTMRGEVLWSVNPELELIPASTAKVFTTGFARAQVGGASRFSTAVVGAGWLEPATGRWRGSWSLELAGDPTLERSGRRGPTLLRLAEELRARGVRVLEGTLTLASPTGPAASAFPAVWNREFEGQLYAPPVGPVTLHENTVSLTFRPGAAVGAPPVLTLAFPAGVEQLVRISATTVPGSRRRLVLLPAADGGWSLVGSIGVHARSAGLSAVAHHPAVVLERAWAAALDRVGIRWERRRVPGTWSPLLPRTVLARIESAPFDTVAVEVNRRSLNIGAELFMQWGARSQIAGPALLTRHVRDVVGPYARVRLVDGSGLSEQNRMSALTQALYLARYPQLPGNERFPLLLPANGFGTLRRLRYGMERGAVRAKTGTLDRVATLTGYLARPDGVLAVSLLYNGPRTAAARAAEWEFLRLLGAEGVSLAHVIETRMGSGAVRGAVRGAMSRGAM